MIKEDAEKNPAIPSGQITKDKSLNAAPSFTPEPWYLDGPNVESEHSCGHETCAEHPRQLTGYDLRRRLDEFDSQWLGSIHGEHVGIPAGECHANARLIAAAPDLFAALQRMDALVESLWKSIPWGETFNLDIAALNEAPLAAKRALALARPQKVEEEPECPDCGCSVRRHNAVNDNGSVVTAHCADCGSCWKSAGTPFAETVRQFLAALAKGEQKQNSDQDQG